MHDAINVIAMVRVGVIHVIRDHGRAHIYQAEQVAEFIVKQVGDQFCLIIQGSKKKICQGLPTNAD